MKYRNILLIDDDKDDREIFLEALMSISTEAVCEMSEDAADALSKLRNGLLKPDIIFLDLQMTLLSGQEFLKQIKMIAYLKEIPVIVLSTHTSEQMRIMTKELGAYDFITKPSSFKGMVSIIESIL